MSFDVLRDRMIGIDTEYHTDQTGAVDRVYCLSATGPDGTSHSWWLNDGRSHKNILADVGSYFGIEEPIFICHAYDVAERQALHFLGSPYPRVLCTYLTAWLCSNAASTVVPDLSLVGLCKSLLHIDIDSTYKDLMRSYCIRGEVEGHESEIMLYCESDTKHLHALAQALVREYDEACRKSIQVRHAFDIGDPCERLLALCDSLTIMGRIADRGLPVSMERIDAAVRGAIEDMDSARAAFSILYPGTFVKISKKARKSRDRIEKTISMMLKALSPFYTLVLPTGFDLDDNGQVIDTRTIGSWKKSTKAVQDALETYCRERGILDAYPRTATGKLKADSETLKAFFKGAEGFGGDLYQLERKLSMLKGIAQRGSKSWVKTARDGRMYYRSLRPFGAQTGRCQPQASLGFVPAWTKMLYCVLDPPQGEWLVELDFGSEEIFLQAVIQKDPAYLQAYTSKDYYLWLCVQLGLVPRSDFDVLPVHDLKEKYGDVRSKIKTFALAWSYGAGAATLAARSGLSVTQAEKVKGLLEGRVFRASTEWKDSVSTALSRSKTRGIALRDGLILRTQGRRGEVMKRATSQGNFPIQGYGSVILRHLVNMIEQEVPEVSLCATIHDAVLFECTEGDVEAIEHVRRCMVRAVREALSLREGSPDIKVGEPEIIRHGELWTPENRFNDEAKALLRAGGLEYV